MEPVQHLTIRQVRKLREITDDTADVQAIAWACGVSMEEADEWFETAPGGEVAKVLARIFEMSGLTDAARFPDPPADDVQPAREG